MAVVGAPVIYQYKLEGSSRGTHDFKGIFDKGPEIRGLVINRYNYRNFRGCSCTHRLPLYKIISLAETAELSLPEFKNL